jgi:DNA (cytosine-5)-methyltransferase 1
VAYRRAISLFSNCGAGDVGYRNAGFRFDVMAELDPRRLEICLLNHPGAIGVSGDLRKTWRKVVSLYRQRAGKIRPTLLAACPPCQGMSSAKSGRGLGNDPDAGSKDHRNLLVVIIALVAKSLLPSIIIVENVQEFLTRKIRHPRTNEPVTAAKLLISLLDSDYEVFPILTDLCDYGVPQKRKRAFLTFIRRDLKGLRRLHLSHRAPYPRPTHTPEYGGPVPMPLQESLHALRLPRLDARSQETAVASSIGNGLHCVPVWPESRYEMVAAIPPNSGASAWENDKCAQCGLVPVGKNDAACPLCRGPLLRPVVQEKDGSYRLIRGFGTSYRRMPPDKPASTITTASGHVSSDYTIHPSENRLLSPLECAYLQTFPPGFNWGEALKKWGHTNVREMIGEAVPPHFTRLHGLALLGVLTDRWSLAPISLSDTRCIVAREKLGLPMLQSN